MFYNVYLHWIYGFKFVVHINAGYVLLLTETCNVLSPIMKKKMLCLVVKFSVELIILPHLVKKFPLLNSHFCINWRFIVVFTGGCDFFLSWARLTQSVPSHLIFRSHLILSSHACLGFRSSLFPSVFLTRMLYAFFLFPIYAPSISSSLI